jgi:hypothetical protein
MYEIMGHGSYYYTVFYIDTQRESAVCIDEAAAEFVLSDKFPEPSVVEDLPTRQEAIPAFREHLQPWLEDAILFVSCDTYDICLSLTDEAYLASDYYDKVWER